MYHADIVEKILCDKVVLAYALYSHRELLMIIGSSVTDVDMLGMTHGNSAGGDIRDKVAADLRVDNIIGHGDTVSARMLNHIARKLYTVTVGDMDCRRKCIRHLVLFRVPVGVCKSGIALCSLTGGLAVGACNVCELIVRIGKGQTAECDILHAVGG